MIYDQNIDNEFENDDENPYVEVEVGIVLTIRRTVKLQVNDYVKFSENTEDNDYYQTEYDFSECDWDAAMENADILPEGWDIEEQTIYYP